MKDLLCHLGNFTLYLKPYKDTWYKKALGKVVQNIIIFFFFFQEDTENVHENSTVSEYIRN